MLGTGAQVPSIFVAMYTRDTVVTVRPFTCQPEGEDVIIGRVETGVFLAVPPAAVKLLEELAQGKSVGQVADWHHQEYGEPVDMDDFLEVMESKGILESRAAGSLKSGDTLPQKAPRTHYHFSGFPQTLAQHLFSGPALAACFVLITLAVVAASKATLIHGWRDLYFPDHRTLSWTILTLGGYIALFVHELAHLVAARALGINSRMGISNRMWYLVAETDLTGLWSVPKKKRYMPMLAGVLVDAVSGSLLILLLYSDTRQWLALPDLAMRLVRAMAFTYVMRLVWQFCLFIRTDFYYVIAGIFNCRNLLSDTKGFLRNLIAHAVPFVRPVDQSGIPVAEKRVIRAYSVLLVAGRLWAIFLLISVTVPLFIRYSGNLVGAFKAGFSADRADFVDATLLAIYFLLPTTIGFSLWVRGLMRRERA
jgi:hypothetical protein